MSFWQKLFGGKDSPDEAEQDVTPAEQAPPEPAPSSSALRAEREEQEQLQRLSCVGQQGGHEADHALQILRSAAASPAQAKVLNALLTGLSAPDVATNRDLDDLRLACAAMLESSGQAEQALALVENVRTVAAMMFSAELYASRGELGRAVSTIERVLARDIDATGARERHERWSEQLGVGKRVKAIDDSATVVAPNVETTAFRLLREVARGGAGTVYEAEDELLGRRIAYKVYHRGGDDSEQIAREARVAVQLAGPNIIRVLDVDPTAGWIATEWLGGGSVRDALKQQQVERLMPLKGWLVEVARALAHIHAAGFVHADIKPANLLFRDDTVVLTDFGICRRAGASAVAGTPGYIAPERLDGADAHYRDDVYALGRVIEDVLALVEQDDHWRDQPAAAQEIERFGRVASACLSGPGQRPESATEVLALLRQ